MLGNSTPSPRSIVTVSLTGEIRRDPACAHPHTDDQGRPIPCPRPAVRQVAGLPCCQMHTPANHPPDDS
jgi:hypothetical protein